MEVDHDKANSKNKKAVLYGSLSYSFSFLLAISWSIDSSFVFIFLGIALFFFYLTLRNIQPASSVYPEKETAENQILQDLKQTLKVKGISAPDESSPKQLAQRKVLFVITGAVLFFFLVIFIGTFSNDDGSDIQFYTQQANDFYNAGQYDSASRYYRKATTLDSEYKEALVGYGNVLTMNEQYDSAIIMYDKALLIDIEYDVALYQKALVHYYQKRYDESVSEAGNLLSVNSSYFEGMQLIGDNYYSQEKYDSALTWYDNAYDNGFRNRYLCHLMGYIYQTKGNTKKAIDLYKEALQYDSSVVDIYERLADIVPDNEKEWCRRKISELQTTIKIDPNKTSDQQ